MSRARVFRALAAALWLAAPAAGIAEEAGGKPDAEGVYYEAPRNLCEELGGTPECPPDSAPPDSAPVNPAKAAPPQAEPEVIYVPPQEDGAPAPGEANTPEAYRQLESDCEKAGWGGAPTCD